MKPGDIVICAFPGAQVTKAHPAVVLTSEHYHRHRPDVIAGLITTQDPTTFGPTDCRLVEWKAAGLHAPSWFRLYLVTLPQRSVRLVGRLSDSDWSAVEFCFQSGFGGK